MGWNLNTEFEGNVAPVAGAGALDDGAELGREREALVAERKRLESLGGTARMYETQSPWFLKPATSQASLQSWTRSCWIPPTS